MPTYLAPHGTLFALRHPPFCIHATRGVYVKDLMQFVVKSVPEISGVLQVRPYRLPSYMRALVGSWLGTCPEAAVS
jgi:hypothetical protein